MENYLMPLLGGALIGTAISFMLYLNGRVTGVSGILNESLQSISAENFWRWSFLAGLLVGGVILRLILPEVFLGAVERNLGILIVSGLLVGFGTVMGSGCTSGHGICGLSRLSLRSFVATLIFMGFGILSATFFRIYLERSL